MKNRVLLLLVAVALGASHCAPPFTLTTPPDFARIENPPEPYQYRAMSAYGIALAVRSVPNPSHGNLAFWAEAVDRTLRRTNAYHPAGTLELRSTNGTPGRRLEYRYGHPQNGSVYVVAVYATENRVWILETGGTQESFQRARPSVESAIASFTTR